MLTLEWEVQYESVEAGKTSQTCHESPISSEAPYFLFWRSKGDINDIKESMNWVTRVIKDLIVIGLHSGVRLSMEQWWNILPSIPPS